MPTRLLGESLAWPLAFGLVEDVLTSTTARSSTPVRCTAVELKQAVEPAGAVALAAAGSVAAHRAALRTILTTNNTGPGRRKTRGHFGLHRRVPSRRGGHPAPFCA